MYSEISNPDGKSEVTRKLLEMERDARSGQLAQEQFPSKEFTPKILSEIMEKKYNERKRNIVFGALESLLFEIDNRPMDEEELANHIRQIAYFTL